MTVIAFELKILIINPQEIDKLILQQYNYNIENNNTDNHEFFSTFSLKIKFIRKKLVLYFKHK